MIHGKHFHWAYLPPLLHLVACMIILLGYIVPSWQYLLVGWKYIVLLDFPASFIGAGLAWSHQVLALIWFVVVGTLWWYLLSLGMRWIVKVLISHYTERGVVSITAPKQQR
jgi:hypothetical protein